MVGKEGPPILRDTNKCIKVTCDMLEGLFNTLTSEFNETIKSLQFKMLCRNDWENVEEWMGRLEGTALECNYQELKQ